MALLDDGVWHGKIWTGGWTTGGGGSYPAIAPATGTALAEVGRATPADVAAAAARAVVAQRAWAAAPYEERARVLRRAGELIEANGDELTDWLAQESGAIRPFGGFQVHTSAAECYEASALPSHPYGELLRTGQPRLSFARRLPVGVVGVIAPFNVPTILAIRAFAPALALGNAVLLKPDPRTAVSGGVFFARVFEEAGLPAGVLQVLPGGADVGEALVTEPAVRVIAFTGSTRAGRAVGALAGQHLKRAHLELGGNSALIVLPDVDVTAAASAGAWGTFSHAGQICMATSRHLVHSSIAEEYTAILTEKVARLPVGDPYRDQVALGPLIDDAQRDRVRAGDGQRGCRRHAAHRRRVRQLVLPTDGARRRSGRGARLRAGDLRPGRAGDAVLLHRRGRRARRGYRLRAVVGHPDRGRLCGTAAGRTHPVGTGAHQRPDGQRRGRRAVRRGRRLGYRFPARRGGANIDAFTETQWVTLRGQLPAYPF